MDLPYRQYFEAMPCFLTIQDRNFRIIDANRRFNENFGNFKDRFCYEVYKHRDTRCEICPVALTFEDGQCHSSEEQVRSMDGRDISVVVHTSPIQDDTGEIVAVMEMSTDITEIKGLQERLRESEERYRLLFDRVPCYISIQDRELKIVEANRRFIKDFGDFTGRCCYEIYKHREEACIPCPVQQTFEDGQVHRREEVVTSCSGEQMNVLVYTAPLHGTDGQIQNVIEMSTNITPIRELQSQLESIGLLVGSISHGIKGLLTGLDGGIYLVNSGMEKDNPERLQQGWEMVQRNVDRIRNMVSNILYYAKERTPDWETVSAPEAAEEVCALMEAKTREQGVELLRNLERDAGDMEVDAKAIRALLINLVDNSLDACRVDRKKNDHQVTFGLRGHPDRVEFEISDNGVGMDQETREKAFSLFFSSKGAEGTGLGLFIAHNIARAHGGSIEMQSEVDRGTRFTVRIPRKRTEIKPK